MDASVARLHLSWRDQDAIIALWLELTEFPASAPQEALDYCLHALARQIGAVNATWFGAIREKNWERKNPHDPLLGWRPNICLTLNPTDEWQRAHEVAMDAVKNNYMDPQTVALASRFGCDRCFLREEVVRDRDWKRDGINREVLAPLGIGHRLIGASATAPGAESYLINDRGAWCGHGRIVRVLPWREPARRRRHSLSRRPFADLHRARADPVPRRPAHQRRRGANARGSLASDIERHD